MYGADVKKCVNAISECMMEEERISRLSFKSTISLSFLLLRVRLPLFSILFNGWEFKDGKKEVDGNSERMH